MRGGKDRQDARPVPARGLWVRALAVVAAGSVAVSAAAQGQAPEGLNDDPGPFPVPRGVMIFAGTTGFADLDAERFGTPAQPKPTELGTFLVMRMFRTICLGLEAGQPMTDLLPEGFAGYDAAGYLLGEDKTTAPGTGVYSSTGSMALDEDEGHPAIRIGRDPKTPTCSIEWQIPGGIPEDRQGPIARLISEWLPFEMSLVRASRPMMSATPPDSDTIEWDRPCGDVWCPVTANYLSSMGLIQLSTTLKKRGE